MGCNIDEHAVITLLHSLAAISPSKARSIHELASYLKCKIEDIKGILNRLHEEGYVDKVDNKFFLATKGWLKVLMYYT
ncbi:MAG: hypothetical protein DRJ49_07800 [Thermoprotei archaeon]|nr:MAG: hypothetical protein DRJ49_07800 [Thermoprotei archaeon]